MLRLGAHALRDLDGADVGRDTQDVGGGQDAEGIAILDQLAAHLDRAVPGVEQHVFVDVAVVEGRGGEEDLHGRAGFDDVAEGAGAGVGVVELAEAIRVEAGRFGEGEDVAGLRVERQHHSALRPAFGDRIREGGFGGALHRGVECEGDLAALDGARILGVEGEVAAAGIAFHPDGAQFAGQPFVFDLLDAAHAFSIDVREADQRGGELACRVAAARLGIDADRLELEGTQLLGLPGIYPACEVGEALVLAEALLDLSNVEAEGSRDGACGRGLVLHQLRDGVDRGRADGERELAAVAVDDDAAGRGEPLCALDLVDVEIVGAWVGDGQVGCASRQHHARGESRESQPGDPAIGLVERLSPHCHSLLDAPESEASPAETAATVGVDVTGWETTTVSGGPSAGSGRETTWAGGRKPRSRAFTASSTGSRSWRRRTIS